MRTFDKIDTLLKEKKIKQVELCNYLGVSKNRYTDWKSGRIKSFVKYLPKIAEYLGVTVEYLTGESEVFDEVLEQLRATENMLKQENGELKLKIYFMEIGMGEKTAEVNVEIAKNRMEYNKAIKNGVPKEEAKNILSTIIPMEVTQEMIAEIQFEESPEIRLKRIEELKRLLKEE